LNLPSITTTRSAGPWRAGGDAARFSDGLCRPFNFAGGCELHHIEIKVNFLRAMSAETGFWCDVKQTSFTSAAALLLLKEKFSIRRTNSMLTGLLPA